MRRLWVLALLAPLPGCLSPAVTVASLAADGTSYAATGKTVADHGVSVATARDCAVIGRVLGDRPICYDRTPDPSVPLEDRRRREFFLVVGSFSDLGNAERETHRFSSYGATIVPSMVSGRRLYRVVVGPVSFTQAASLGADTWKAPPQASPATSASFERARLPDGR
jgi:hypothetical protein